MDRLAMTALAALLLAACGSSTPAETGSGAEEEPMATAKTGSDDEGAGVVALDEAGSGYRFLVGELTAEGVEVCKADGTEEWVNPHHAVGFTVLKPKEGLSLDALEGQVVVLRGAVDPKGMRFPPVRYEAECLPKQMRSDWVISKSGIRLQREGMGEVGPAFAVEGAEAWPGFEVTRSGDTLHVKLENTFEEPLVSVVVTVHYEGCYGKPGTAEEKAQAPVLAHGEKLERDFPAFVEEASNTPNRTTHRAFSVQLQARSKEVAFDFDRRLS
ncbi:MAG: hypothetical protein KC635_24160, partial [Myxococcales bacterium]|nr:hypothetical protein [Myxococcales bacterium]